VTEHFVAKRNRGKKGKKKFEGRKASQGQVMVSLLGYGHRRNQINKLRKRRGINGWGRGERRKKEGKVAEPAMREDKNGGVDTLDYLTQQTADRMKTWRGGKKIGHKDR